MARQKIYKTKKQKTKAQANWTKKWAKENTKLINFRFNLETDKEILDKLDSVPNKTEYVKGLIVEDIKKGQFCLFFDTDMKMKIGGVIICLCLIAISIVAMVVFRTNDNYLTIFVPLAIVIVFLSFLMIKTIKEQPF